ncbi:MAG TPA: pilus assembly protein TadG-related protein, partial [Acidobacteriaceae bacterium]|nr:pilus assembly protein TadG-related protein [Acidobacteriaceae bacterium]
GGQVIVSLLLMLALFLIAMMGFAVDLTNLWFHRQAAQSAADAACQAGAMDMSAIAAGLNPTNAGFTPGTTGDCSANPGASICFYAKVNGYSGAGFNAGASSNSVTWDFPTAVAGTNAPPASVSSYPFLNVQVAENVKTHFLFSLHGMRYQKVVASCTCGLVQERAAAPMIVLAPNQSGSFTYTGGGNFNIVGGPQRSLQVNSTSSIAVNCISGLINTSQGGAQSTGSDVAVTGGPLQAPTTCSGGGFNGGTTGHWDSGASPIPDPYAGVGVPTSVQALEPLGGTGGTSVLKAASMSTAGQDGCPDPANNCVEFAPGYYPSGISTTGSQTYIFLPGIYYMGGPFDAGGSSTLRMATPCNPTCSPLSSSTGQQTDGLMFYFYGGTIKISGSSGTNTALIPVTSTALTCDGSAPNPGLNIPASLNGNILLAQCATNGTYWDAGGDTPDSRGNPGSRGILIYQDHANTSNPVFAGSGALSFSGALYFHSTGYSDSLTINGGSSTGTFILGQIVADQVSLTGSGAINLALNPKPSTYLLKVGMLQ